MIVKFATGQLGALRSLHCNLTKIKSTAYSPSEDELRSFDSIYQLLRQDLLRQNIAVYFHGVKVNFSIPFSSYKFEDRLIKCHYHNYIVNRLPVARFTSITEFDFIDQRDVSAIGADFGTLDWSPDTGRLIQETVRFSFLYPNLQCIVLEEKQNRKTQQTCFYDVLRDCRSLRDLQISYTDFPVNFYDRMAELDSLCNLTDFYLAEMDDRPIYMNFDFLQKWPCLLRFTSNMVRKPVMLKLIERMRPGTRSIFLICSHAETSYLHVIVQKKSDSKLEIIIEDDVKKTETKATVNCYSLATFFDTAGHGNFRHWLDEREEEESGESNQLGAESQEPHFF